MLCTQLIEGDHHHHGGDHDHHGGDHDHHEGDHDHHSLQSEDILAYCQKNIIDFTCSNGNFSMLNLNEGDHDHHEGDHDHHGGDHDHHE